MKPSNRILAWALSGAALILMPLAAIAAWLAFDVTPDLARPPLFIPVSYTVAGMVIAITGGLIASRVPRNPIGWLLLLEALLQAVGNSTQVYVQLAEGTTLRLPAAEYAPALWPALTTLRFSVFAFITLLFPDGRLPSWHLRSAAIVVLVTAAIGALNVLNPLIDSAPPHAPFRNPLGIAWPPLQVVQGFAMPALLGGVILGFAAAIWRFRHSQGAERQQLKWFAYAAAAAGISLLAGVALVIGAGIAGIDLAPDRMPYELLVAATVLVQMPLPLLIPIAIAIAMLRYRLYDIDVLINRTLVYGTLSALLIALYFVSLVVLQSVLRAITGGSEVAVAASTVLVVGLFQPVRRRLQDAVDRRFYRHKYDAVSAIDLFSARLSEQVDLDALQAELVEVVRDTVQPTQVSLWLSPTGPRR